MKIFKILAITISLLVSLVATQTSDLTCTQVTPTKASDCNTHSTNTGNYCCFLNLVQGSSTSNMCMSIPKVSYDGASTYNYNQKIYYLDCGQGTASNSTEILATCGPSGAVSKGDCATGSSYINSCCYYTGSGATVTPAPKQGCFWLGTKYSGDTTWAGMPLSCSADFKIASMSLLFFFLIFIF